MRRETLTGDEVRALRKALHLTQESFAMELHVTTATVNRWERGHARPTPSLAQRMRVMRSALAGQRAQAVA